MKLVRCANRQIPPPLGEPVHVLIEEPQREVQLAVLEEVTQGELLALPERTLGGAFFFEPLFHL